MFKRVWILGLLLLSGLPALLGLETPAKESVSNQARVYAAPQGKIETTLADDHIAPSQPAEEEPIPADIPEEEPAIPYLPQIDLSEELQTFTFALCEELDVSYPLVLGVMEVESRFQTDALLRTKGAEMIGLMQINSRYAPAHCDKYGVDDPYDPQDNIAIGVHLLQELTARNGEAYGLMEYNMGIVGMRRNRDKGVTETSYTRKVLQAKQKYAELLAEC